jgi:hypothetical protein
MSLHAGPAGTALTLEYQGRTYAARPITDEVLGEFEVMLAGRARRALESIKPALTREEYLARLDAIARDFEEGAYSLYAPRGQEALTRRDGALAVAALLFGVGKAEMLRLMNANQERVRAIVTAVSRESFPPGAAGPQAAEAEAAPEKNP